MGRPLVLLQAISLLVLISCAVSSPRLHLKDQSTAVDAKAEFRTTHRRLQEQVGDVCYEGCFAVPTSDPWATPLSTVLSRGDHTGDYMQLLDCYLLAQAANLTYFAIFDQFDCYGGNAPLQGWSQDDCPVECRPEDFDGGFCGGRTKASLFSMGACRPEPPCSSPPSPPKPSPPAGAKKYRCKPGIALWGTALPGSPVKMSNRADHRVNTVDCQKICDATPLCQGYYYKTTRWCYMMSKVQGWGKKYATAVQACKVSA